MKNLIIIIILIVVFWVCASSFYLYYVSKRNNEIQSSINNIEIATHRSMINSNSDSLQ